MNNNVDRAFIRALKYDYYGEVVTEVTFRIQSYITFNTEVAAKAREFADLEASTRQMIGVELERHGIKMGRCLWLQWLIFMLLIIVPIKLLIPTRLWVYLIHRSTLSAMDLYTSQQKRWSHINPEFFDRLVDHEVKQRDWAADYLARCRSGSVHQKEQKS